MSSPRRTRGTLGTVALVAGLAVAVPTSAQAATHDTTSTSASTITLGSTFRSALRAQGVRLAVGRPGTLKGTRLRLPVTSSRTASGSTTLTHSGTLTLRKGTRSARLTSFRTVVRSRTASVTAIVAKKRRTVFTISGGRLTRDRTTGAVTVSGGTVRLSSAAVKQLRTSLRASGLRTGVVGRLAATVRPSTPAASPAPTPAPAPAPAPMPTPAPAPSPAPAPTPTPTPDPTPEPSDPCPSDVTAATAGASWAVKTSFLSYVQGPIAKGRVEVCDGAVAEKDGAGKTTLVHLAPTTSASYQPDSGEVAVTVGGSIHVTGHDSGKGPLLDVEFENLRVRSTDGASGQLLADVSSRPFGGMDPGATPPAPVTTADVVLATLDLTGRATTADGVRSWADVPVVLTEDGAEAFGGFYAAGEALAPLSFKARAASLDWTQVNVYGAAGQTPANRTFLGYLTNPAVGAGPRGTFTPSAGATGPTVTPTSERGADKTYTTRFAVTSSTLSAATKTGVVRLRGLVTFSSPAPPSGHGITITVTDPRIVFDGSAVAKLYATGVRASGVGTTAPYDETNAVFDLAVGAATANANGTATFAGLVPSIATTDWTFPANYPAGSGPDRTPNTFGSFALTVPAG